MSNIKVNSVNDASGGVLAQINGYTPSPSNMQGRNKIINGTHEINQSGLTSLTPSPAGTYYLTDLWAAVFNALGRYAFIRNWAGVTAPEGFSDYLTATHIGVTTAPTAGEYWTFQQRISGYNVSDLGWGTANAKTVTLSFKVRSTATGLMGGALQNADATRSYPFGFTIAAANTWQDVTVTVPGDTAGTWLTTSGTGISVVLNIGAGSSMVTTAGAWASGNFVGVTGQVQLAGLASSNFSFTGVQLEVGTVATPFAYRMYGDELRLCQDYGITTGTPLPIYQCRAWVNFDGTRDTSGAVSTANTNRLIRGSGNVTSVLRNALGDYTISFTTAMPDANYAASLSAQIESNGTNWVLPSLYAAGTPLTAATARMTMSPTGGGGGGNVDSDFICASFFR